MLYDFFFFFFFVSTRLGIYLADYTLDTYTPTHLHKAKWFSKPALTLSVESISRHRLIYRSFAPLNRARVKSRFDPSRQISIESRKRERERKKKVVDLSHLINVWARSKEFGMNWIVEIVVGKLVGIKDGEEIIYLNIWIVLER